MIEVSLFLEMFWLKATIKPPEIKKNPLAVSPEGAHSVYIGIHVCRHLGKKSLVSWLNNDIFIPHLRNF